MKNTQIKREIAMIMAVIMVFFGTGSVDTVARMIQMLTAGNTITAQAATKYVKISDATKTIGVGQQTTLSLKNNTVKWMIKKAVSNKPAVAKVVKFNTKKAIVKGKATGKATVKLTLNTTAQQKKVTKKVVKCVFTVKQVSVPATASVTAGQQTEISLKNNYLNWEITEAISSDETIATVVDATSKKVTIGGVAAGTATIKTTIASGSKTKVLKTVVTVEAQQEPVVEDPVTEPEQPVVKKATAGTTKEILEALKNPNLEELTICTDKEEMFSITGEYPNLKVIVDSPKVSVINTASLKNVDIYAVSSDTWYEQGRNNIINLLCDKSHVVVNGNSSGTIINVNKEGTHKIEAINECTVNVNKKANVTVEGNHGKATINVKAANSQIIVQTVATINLDVEAFITLTMGGLNSVIENRTAQSVTVTIPYGTHTVAGGQKATIVGYGSSDSVGGWTGTGTGTNTPSNPSNQSKQYKITFGTAGAGTGTLIVKKNGMDVPYDSITVKGTDILEAIAMPADDSFLESWTGSSSKETTLTLTGFSADATYVANFAKKPVEEKPDEPKPVTKKYQIAVQVIGDGVGKVGSIDGLSNGSTLELEEGSYPLDGTACEGYSLKEVLVNGVSTRSLVLTKNVTVTFIFSKNEPIVEPGGPDDPDAEEYTANVTTDGNGAGRVLIKVDGVDASGTQVTFTSKSALEFIPIAEEGSYFGKWLGYSTGTDNPLRLSGLTQSINLCAWFEVTPIDPPVDPTPVSHKVTFSYNGTVSEVNLTADEVSGLNVPTVTDTEEERFSHWTVNGTGTYKTEAEVKTAISEILLGCGESQTVAVNAVMETIERPTPVSHKVTFSYNGTTSEVEITEDEVSGLNVPTVTDTEEERFSHWTVNGTGTYKTETEVREAIAEILSSNESQTVAVKAVMELINPISIVFEYKNNGNDRRSEQVIASFDKIDVPTQFGGDNWSFLYWHIADADGEHYATDEAMLRAVEELIKAGVRNFRIVAEYEPHPVTQYHTVVTDGCTVRDKSEDDRYLRGSAVYVEAPKFNEEGEPFAYMIIDGVETARWSSTVYSWNHLDADHTVVAVYGTGFEYVPYRTIFVSYKDVGTTPCIVLTGEYEATTSEGYTVKGYGVNWSLDQNTILDPNEADYDPTAANQKFIGNSYESRRYPRALDVTAYLASDEVTTMYALFYVQVEKDGVTEYLTTNIITVTDVAAGYNTWKAESES